MEEITEARPGRSQRQTNARQGLKGVCVNFGTKHQKGTVLASGRQLLLSPEGRGS